MEPETLHTETLHPDTVSLKEWVITLIIAAIPVIGFIMLFVWGFGGGANPNKANWAKASLVCLVLVGLFYLLIFLLVGYFFSTSSISRTFHS